VVGADVGCQGQAHANAHFEATLGDHLLSSVAWQPNRNLSATVPAGLPVGLYDLHVLAPNGSELLLQNAYEVLPPGAGGDGGATDAGDAGSSCETLFANAEMASNNGTTMNGTNALGPPDGMAGQVSGQWAANGESWTFSFPASTQTGMIVATASAVLWVSGPYVDDNVALESSSDGGQTWTKIAGWGAQNSGTFPLLRADVGPFVIANLTAPPRADGQARVRLRGDGAAGASDNFTLHVDAVSLQLCP